MSLIIAFFFFYFNIDTIYDLQPHPLNDNHILSTSKDGTVRLWDVNQEKCLFVFEANITLTVSVS